jgi:hypothetical protein
LTVSSFFTFLLSSHRVLVCLFSLFFHFL